MIINRFIPCFGLSRRAAQALLLALMLAAVPAFAGDLDALNGTEPMNGDELADAYGGFEAANGMELTVGIERDTYLDGALVSSVHYGSGAGAVNTSPSQISIKSTGGLTQIAQTATATAIVNTANNIGINQVNTINVDIANYSKFNPAATAALQSLQSQAGIMRNQFH